MEAQGYTIKKYRLHQDNKFTILPANNCCMFAGKANKHTKHCVFLITDKITQDTFTIQHRSAELMWASGNTKAL